jgi:hypothetical protein
MVLLRGMSRLVHYNLHHTIHTLHRTPYTLHPTPYTIHPTPYTLHHTPYTLHPKPYTLHPTPYTLHPTPYTLNPFLLAYRGPPGTSRADSAPSTLNPTPNKPKRPFTTGLPGAVRHLPRKFSAFEPSCSTVVPCTCRPATLQVMGIPRCHFSQTLCGRSSFFGVGERPECVHLGT